MIYLGLKDEEKIAKITEYARENGIQHIVIFSGEIGGQVTNSKIKKTFSRLSFGYKGDCGCIRYAASALYIWRRSNDHNAR